MNLYRRASVGLVAMSLAFALAVTGVMVMEPANPVGALESLGSPTSVRADVDGGEVTLQWSPPVPSTAGPVVGYNIERNGAYVTTVTSGLEFSDDAVSAGETYRYKVAAFAGGPGDRIYGPYSDEITVVVEQPNAPAAPERDDGTCVGATVEQLDDAKQSYSEMCGVIYSDSSGVHRCSWSPAGWQCVGPSGAKPQIPVGLTARTVRGDTDTPNPDGVKLTWNAGGGAESIGFNISRDGDYITTVQDRLFVDCDVVRGQSYSYTVAAFSEGPVFSPSTTPVSVVAGVTPSECRSLTPPGPGGPDGPYEDPIFDHPRDMAAKPATPSDVRINAGMLQWKMPTGPRMLFQIHRNYREETDGDRWGQLVVTSGHPDLTYRELPDEQVQFSIPVEQFDPGDRFSIHAIHPYEVSEIDDAMRMSKSSRFATLPKAGPGTPIGDFLSTLGTDEQPPGSWIGERDDWQLTQQFNDDFNGSGRLADRPETDSTTGEPNWYFARTDGPMEVWPSPRRDGTFSDERAVLRDGKLEMSVSLDDSSYSYIGSANGGKEGFVIDPTNGVFVEASVKLDRFSPADNAWWSFWLMAPGADPCDADGNAHPSNWNAYDGDPRTGSEVDIFEAVPDLANGWNQAIHIYEWMDRHATCTVPSSSTLSPYGRSFTYEGHEAIPGVDMPTYMDGDYHRIGMYYAQDCYAFYLDDQLLWQVNEDDDPGWVTPTKRQSIRMTWEMQNPHTASWGDWIPNQWTDRGGNFSSTAIDDDPTVYIDFVNVWEKKEEANGLCSGEPDPVPEPEPEPDPVLVAPVDVTATSGAETIALTWAAGDGLEPDGYNVHRDGDGVWSGTATTFTDNVAAGATHTYTVVAWTTVEDDGQNGGRRYGPHSEPVTAQAGDQPAPEPEPQPEPEPEPEPDPDLVLQAPNDFVVTPGNQSIVLTWAPGGGVEPDGYDIRRDGEGYWSSTEARFTDAVPAGESHAYSVVAWAVGGDGERVYGPHSDTISAQAGGADTTPDPVDPDPVDPDPVDPDPVDPDPVDPDPVDPDPVDPDPVDPDPVDPDPVDPDPVDPALGLPIDVVVTGSTIRSVSLSWADWAADNQLDIDGYEIERVGAGILEGRRFTSDTSLTYVGNWLYAPLQPNTTYEFTVRAFSDNGAEGFAIFTERTFGPKTLVVARTAAIPDDPAPPGPASNLAAIRTFDALSDSVEVELFWDAPVGWEDSVDGYELRLNGVFFDRVSDEESRVDPKYRSNLRRTIDGPFTPGSGTVLPGPGRYALLVGDRLDYEVRAFAETVDGRRIHGPWSPTESWFLGDGGLLNVVPEDVAFWRRPAMRRVIDKVFPAASPERKTQLTTMLIDAHYRHFGRTPETAYVNESRLRAFLTLAIEEGVDIGVDPASLGMFSGISNAETNSALVTRLVTEYYPPTKLADIVPGFPPDGGIGPEVAVAQMRHGALGLSSQERLDAFFDNAVVLDAALEKVNGKQSKTNFRNAKNAALRQARLLLDINAPQRDLFRAADEINNGIHPRRTVYVDDGPNTTKPAPNAFSRLWNASTTEERLAYYGLDPVGWEFAAPLIELADQMAIGERRASGSWFKKLVLVVIGLGIAYVTGGLATAGWGSFFGAAAGATPTFAATAFGVTVGAYSSTFFLTGGSTSASEKAAFRALFTSVLTHYAEIPATDRTSGQVLGVALIEGGLARLDGKEFKAAFLSSLALHYTPGLADHLDRLGNFSQFAEDLAGVLIESYIVNDGDGSKIADDLEAFVLQELGEYVSNYVGDRLPAEWGVFGEGLGDVVGVAITRPGDEAGIRLAIGRMVADTISAELRPLLTSNGEENFATELYDKLTSVLVDSLELDSDERAAFIDRQMRAWIFDKAGAAISGSLRNRLVGLNGGESSALIDELALFADVAVSNLWRDGDDFRAALTAHITERLTGALTGLFPTCLPAWVDAFGDQLVDIAVNAAIVGTSDDIEDDVTTLFNQTVQSGALADGGTCDGAAQAATGSDDATLGEPGTACSAAAAAPTATGRSSMLKVGFAVEDRAGSGSCSFPAAFQNWLIDLGRSEVRTSVTVSNASSGRLDRQFVTESNGSQFGNFRLQTTPGGVIGFVQEWDGATRRWFEVSGPLRVGIVRDAGGSITDFSEYAESTLEAFLGSDRAAAPWVVWNFVNGCASVVTDIAGSLEAAFIELWESEDIVQYLTLKWEQFEAIRDAFEHNPAAFFEQFLRGIVRLDLLAENPAEWAGVITCEIAAGMIPGVGGARFAGLFRAFENPRRALDDFRAANPNDPDAPIGCAPERVVGNGCGSSYPRTTTSLDPNVRSVDRIRVEGVGVRSVDVSAEPVVWKGLPAWEYHFEIDGWVQPSTKRTGLEEDLTLASQHNAEPGTFDRSHLSGSGGMGHEVNLTLHAPKAFNRAGGFMRNVEICLQRGQKIAEANGWELRYSVSAVAYPSNEFSSMALRSVEYRADYVLADGSVVGQYLHAVGNVSVPKLNSAGRVIPGQSSVRQFAWPAPC